MPGLEVAVAKLASAAGIDIVLGTKVPWLSGRGHLDDVVQSDAPASAINALAEIHLTLGGDADLLASKRAGNAPTPDLVHRPSGTIIEVDEVQHSTTARERSLRLYPGDAVTAFDLDRYLDLVSTWRAKGDAAFAHKTAKDFPAPGGRQAQRAYNDSLRDLLAPTFTGHPVIRVAVPDRSLAGVADRLLAHLPSV